jgi:predicted DNA-binding ribbon-helix-helix protein
MCKLFSRLDPKSYTFQIRSVLLGGHATSIRLEAMFWNILEKLAAEEGATLDRFLTKLHDEPLRFHGEANDFTSLLRCACLVYVESKKGIFDALGAPSDKE